MNTFLYIVINIIMPIFLLIIIGFVGQKNLNMDISTLTKLNIYIFIPAILFLKIYETKVTLRFFSQIFVFMLAILTAMFLIGHLIAKVFNFSRSIRKAFCNSLLFFNSGNYGLPLVELVFKGNPTAVTSQIFVMLIQNITTSTFGVFQASSGSSNSKKAILSIFKMPSIYILSVAFIVRGFYITIPEFVLTPLEYVGRGYVAIGLLTLGAQLSEIKLGIKIRDIFLSSFTRLIVSPLLGFVLVWAMGIQGILAQALIIGVSTPSAVNTALLAKEFNNEPEYASQIVFVSTMLSSLTISLVIYLTGKIF